MRKNLKRFFHASIAWKLVVLVFWFSGADLFGQDGQRVSVEVNYLGGELETRFDYPKSNPPFSSGKRYDSDGLQIGAVVRISDRVAIGGRWEESFLRRTRFSHEGRFDTRIDPDTNIVGTDSRYQEVYASVALPKTGRHRLIAGVARTEHAQEWEFMIFPSPPPSVGSTPPPPPPFRINSREKATDVGPMVGIEGGKSAGRLGLNWSGRYYPRMARSDHYSSVVEMGNPGEPVNSKWSSASQGFELRGAASYSLSRNLAIQGGYQYRRLDEPDQFGGSWPVNETGTQKSFIGGIKFTF